jgi:hypothetical protein
METIAATRGGRIFRLDAAAWASGASDQRIFIFG